MIICCGEALIDMLPRPLANGEDGFLPKNGGSIYNTAIALARLGNATGFLSGLSLDFFGDSLKAGLMASGVDLRYTVFKNLPTMLAFVKLIEGHARYSFYDDNSAPRMLNAKDLPKLGAEVTALHIGSIGLVHRPAADTYAHLLQREAKKRVICLDPNIRPSVIASKPAYLKRLKPLLALADIIKLSDEDIAWMTGGRDAAQVARGWLKAGAKLVVVTKGAEGALAYTKDFNLARQGIKIKVVDTVGAGDTFSAGLLTYFSRAKLLDKKKLSTLNESDIAGALDFAARAAAITCSRVGADPPWAEEMTDALA